MFSGMVGQTAAFIALKRGQKHVLTIACQLQPLRIGDSLGVNGACLTVVSMNGDRVDFHLSPETLKLANFADLVKGDRVNIEQPLRLNDFLGGHLVTGHIDGTVRVRDIDRQPQSWKFSFTYQKPEWQKFLVPKGSVTLNGISLTPAEVKASSFVVHVIPHTLEVTNLKFLRIGQRVNIELDLIAKYLYNFSTGK